MIVKASVEFIAPKFQAGLITPIYTPTDVAEMIELAAKHQVQVTR
jgi:hypothetical protein